MNRITLTTEDIFEKDGLRMKILTEGIDLKERFEDNPIMLFEHNPEKVLGTWVGLEINENRISALPDFDDDEFSIDISNKLKKGSIKSASIGIEINDAYMEGDIAIISKSTLFEASIVGIPANKHAKAVELSKGNMIFLSSNGKEVNTEEYFKKLKDMAEKDPKQEPEMVEKAELDKLNLSLTNKDKEIDEFKKDKLELGLKITDLEKSIKELNDEKEKLNLSIVDKDKEVNDLKASVKKLEDEKFDNLLLSAVSEGKISKEAVEDFKELSFEKAKTLLSKLSPSQVSLTETLEFSKRSNASGDEKTYEWYLKNDKEGLRKLSKDNPSLYKQLEENYIKK